MNSLTKVLVSVDRDFLLLSSKEKTCILSVVMQYVFGIADSAEMIETIRQHLEWDGAKSKEFRIALKFTGIVQKSLKMYMYERFLSTERVSSVKYGLEKDDVDLVSGLLRSKHPEARLLRAGMYKFNKDGHRPVTTEVFDRRVKAIMDEIEVGLSKFVWAKFRFLTENGQLDRDSIMAELRVYAIWAIYKRYPRISTPSHMKNIAFRAAHNRGINIIKQQTTRGRLRMTRGENGVYTGNILSLHHTNADSLFESSGSVRVSNNLMVDLEGIQCPNEPLRDMESRRDLIGAVQSLMTSLRNDKQRKFVSLLMGEHDVEFSAWLGRDNEDASNDMSREEYAENVRKYMECPASKAKALVNHMRHYMAAYQ